MLRTILSGTVVALLSLQAGAQSGDPIDYQLSFGDARHHYIEVQAQVPTGGAAAVEMFLPVWTPGSYMLREYSKSLEGFQASANGAPLQVERTRKNRWKIASKGAPSVQLSYRVYGHEMSVRNNWVDSDFAIVTPAATFVSEVGKVQRPYRVTVKLPADWKQCLTGLSPAGAPLTYQAKDYDELIDSPLLMGNPTVTHVPVRGVDHVLVDQGGAGVWDSARSAVDVGKLMEAAYGVWGFFPYASEAPNTYTFFNILLQPGGGLEHHNSTVLMSSRWAQRLHKDYLGWLSLVAHENFHAWNVKRMRPAALRPFDYENENYTPSLWVAEGFTAYYDDLLVRRAGFSTHKEYLESLSKTIEQQQSTPGRLVQSLFDSSYDAWVKYYRPDDNSSNTGISYYTKGSLVAFLLDAEVRRSTDGKKSLDDVMRTVYKRYSGERGYTDAEFRQTAEEVAGKPLGEFFKRYVDGTAELDFAPALQFYGLRRKKDDKKDPDPAPSFLGATTESRGGKLMVLSVKRDTPAYAAGLNAEDEIVAVDDLRVNPEKWVDRLKQLPAGSNVVLLVCRRDLMRRLPVTMGHKPEEWILEVDPAAAPEAKEHLARWLGPEKK